MNIINTSLHFPGRMFLHKLFPVLYGTLLGTALHHPRYEEYFRIIFCLSVIGAVLINIQ